MLLLTAAGVTAAASGISAALAFHPASPWGRPVVRLDSPRIALTFDDGPDPDWTPRVLDRLDAAGVHASFFVLSAAGEAHPGLLRRMVDAGHTVEVHGGRHRYAFLTTPRALDAEVAAAAAVVERHTGRAPRWYRPPFGARPLRPARRVAGLRLVTWSWSAGDWAGGADPDAAVPPTVAGDILLLHDGPSPATTARPRTMVALDALLRAHGARLGPLPDPPD